MSNVGRFVDRYPNIRAAGVTTTVPDEKIDDNFKFYPEHDFHENLFRADCMEKMRLKQIEAGGVSPCLPSESELKKILSPEMQKSRFKEYQDKFNEATHSRKALLGKVAHFIKSKPDHITNENTCFGITSKDSEDTNLYELILPKKSPQEVINEHCQGHELYIKSHSHYFAGEQINRKYNPPFDRNASYGVNTDIDPSGINVKRALEECKQQIFINKRLEYYYRRAMGVVGGKLRRYDDPMDYERILAQVKPQQRANDCHARAVIENLERCGKNNEEAMALAYLHGLRLRLFKNPFFFLVDFEEAMAEEDVDRTGSLPLRKIFDIGRKMHIYFNEHKIRIVLHLLGMIDDVNVCDDVMIDCSVFLAMINRRILLPQVDVARRPCRCDDQTTTYGLLCKDLEKWTDDSRVVTVTKKKKMRKDDDYQCCSVGGLIAPTIPQQFGVESKDFEEKRPKAELQRIFRILMDSETFDKIWQKTKDKLQPTNDLMSVQEIRQEYEAQYEENLESNKIN